MSAEARIDIEWGGEFVYLRVDTDGAHIELSITDATADDLHAQLTWAASEVRRFRAHVAVGDDASLFQCEPKPGRIGGESR